MSPNILSESEMFFNSFEPKTKNRFVIYIDGIPSFAVRKVERPKYSAEQKVLPHINVERYIKGKSKWAPLSMTLYDPIVPSGAQMIMEWVRLSHESITGRDGYADMYKKDLVLNMLGPVGDKVEEWILKGAFIVEANFGDADFSSDDPAEINITVSIDYAILNY